MPPRTTFTLEYWRDGDWYVGRLLDVPGVMSQGATLRDLKTNIADAYRLMRRVRGGFAVERFAHGGYNSSETDMKPSIKKTNTPHTMKSNTEAFPDAKTLSRIRDKLSDVNYRGVNRSITRRVRASRPT